MTDQVLMDRRGDIFIGIPLYTHNQWRKPFMFMIKLSDTYGEINAGTFFVRTEDANVYYEFLGDL